MTARDTKKLLIEALDRTGDSPKDVSCFYSRNWPVKSDPMPVIPKCSAADLPEGEWLVLRCRSEKYVYTLVKTDTETKIKTSQY